MFTPTITADFKIMNILPDTSSEWLGAAITLQNGNLLLVSESWGSSGEVFMRQFTADGRSLTSAAQVNTTTFGAQKEVEVTQLANGNFVVGWTDSSATAPDFSGTTVRFQMFDAVGNKVGGEIAAPSLPNGNQALSSIVELADGRFAVVWANSADNTMRLRAYNPDGTTSGSEQILANAIDQRTIEGITPFGAHGFAQVLMGGTFSRPTISVQRYSDVGDPMGGPVTVTTGSGFRAVKIEELSDGKLVVTWTDTSETPPYNHGSIVRGQVLNADGSASGGVFTVSEDIFSEHRASKITALDDGRFVVTWNTGPADEVYQHKDVMRLYNADGTAASEIITVYDQQQTYDGIRLLSGSIRSISELPDGRLVYSYSALTPSGSDFITATRIVDPRSALDVTLGAGHDDFTGTRYADAINSGAGNDSLYGGDGADTVYADLGNDFIGGGDGNDSLYGGDGADTIYAGLGNDFVGGGAGNDLIFGSAGSNVIYAGLGNDTVQGGSGSDTIYGSAGRNQLFGNDGNDLIYTSAAGDLAAGGAGNDSIYGSDGADTIYAGLGNDFIGGGAGNDLIYAGSGANQIFSGFGDDRIVAGTGKDVMNAGPGADVFEFSSAAAIGFGPGRDVIVGFTSGVDDIDLRALGTSFNGSAGLLGGGAKSFYYFASGGLLIGDQNGDGVADWVLELTGAPPVAAGDFLL